mgnify:FL=1|tara:strand:+ start:148 stop:660 length:513 start_codon:yes stop_codon:yes gene_type:complete
MITVGSDFPTFDLTGVGEENEFVNVSTANITNNWSVVYFYPKDFTFICPTEIKAMDMLVEDATVIGISGDNEFCKLAWKQQVGSLITHIKHSLAADCGLSLAEDCGVVDWDNGVCYRATFIIDPNGIVQHVSVNALDTGRNAKEILRTLLALKAGGLTGCDWQWGDGFVG